MNENKYYVYCFYNEDWHDIFYIGKGCGYRYKMNHKRNYHVNAILEKHNCTSKILVDNLTESEAIDKEQKLKKEYKMNGSPIIDYEEFSIHNHQRYGIAEAKKQGKYKGRQPIKIDEQQFNEVYKRWNNDEITARQAMQELGLKPDTFYRRVKAYEKK